VAESAGNAALLAGTVRVHEGCVMVAPDWDSAELTIPLFPDRALSLDGDVVIYTPVIGRPVRLADGAKVSLGGGGTQRMTAPAAANGGDDDAVPGRGCPSGPVFLVASGEPG
jgi:hypothetical protein